MADDYAGSYRPPPGKSPGRPEQRRRVSDSGFRALFQPKVVFGAFLLIAGWGFTAGKWVSQGEHTDASLSAQIQAVDKKVTEGNEVFTKTLEGRLSPEALDRRYVSREIYESDVAWIKQALLRIEAAEARRLGR